MSKLTVREQILDVAGFKQEKERELGRALSSAAASKIWMDKVQFARSSDKVSVTWIETAITVFNRVLSGPAAAKIIEYCDEHYPDVISSVHFLHALVKRAGDEEHIIRALEGLLDHYRMG